MEYDVQYSFLISQEHIIDALLFVALYFFGFGFHLLVKNDVGPFVLPPTRVSALVLV